MATPIFSTRFGLTDFFLKSFGHPAKIFCINCKNDHSVLLYCWRKNSMYYVIETEIWDCILYKNYCYVSINVHSCVPRVFTHYDSTLCNAYILTFFMYDLKHYTELRTYIFLYIYKKKIVLFVYFFIYTLYVII